MKCILQILLSTTAIAVSTSTSLVGWETGPLPSATTITAAATPKVSEAIPADLGFCAMSLTSKRAIEPTQGADGIPPDLDLCAGASTCFGHRQLAVPSISSAAFPTDQFITYVHEVMPVGSDMPSDHHHFHSTSSHQPFASIEQPSASIKQASASSNASGISVSISVSKPATTFKQLVRRGWCDGKVDECVAKWVGLTRNDCKKWICKYYNCYFAACGSWGKR